PAVGWREAAARHRPPAAQGPRGGRARRGDRAPRLRVRGGRAGRARGCPGRADLARDRPPAGHGPRRRPDPRGRPRPHRRARHPRRAARRRRALLRARAHPAARRHHPRPRLTPVRTHPVRTHPVRIGPAPAWVFPIRGLRAPRTGLLSGQMSSSVVPIVTPASESTRRRLSPRQAATVQKLVVAAVEELREVGYDALTVRNVARRAGVAPATAYNYFTSREHLVTEVFWRRLDALPETPL